MERTALTTSLDWLFGEKACIALFAFSYLDLCTCYMWLLAYIESIISWLRY